MINTDILKKIDETEQDILEKIRIQDTVGITYSHWTQICLKDTVQEDEKCGNHSFTSPLDLFREAEIDFKGNNNEEMSKQFYEISYTNNTIWQKYRTHFNHNNDGEERKITHMRSNMMVGLPLQTQDKRHYHFYDDYEA